MHAEPTAGAGDERGLAHLQLADVAYAVEERPDRARGDRGFGERHTLGNERDIVVADRHVLGIAADHAPVAEELPVGAQRLAPAAAEPARAADVIALRGRHAIARLEAGHLAPDLDDGAGDLVPQNARQLDAGLERAVARQTV